MIIAVIEPSVLFISQPTWNNDTLRDRFIAHMVSHLETIAESVCVPILWSTDLDALLYGNVYEQPWISDQDWGNVFLPVIYKHFTTRTKLVDYQSTPCFVSEPLSLGCLNAPVINDRFLELIHRVICTEDDILLCLGIENIGKLSALAFTCACHSCQLDPEIIKTTSDWDQFISIDNFWPKSSDDSDRLSLAIKLTAKIDLGKKPSEFRYSFEYSDRFLQDLSADKRSSPEILYAIAKRLTLFQKEASNDKGLKDEPVKGKDGERRFRVSGEKRIHYNYNETGGISFARYFRDGKHDDGL